MKKLFYIFFSLSFYFSAVSQPTDSIRYDYNSVVKTKTSEKIKTFLEDDYYKYDSRAPKETESIWDKLWTWVYKFFRFIESGGKPVSFSFYAVMTIVLLVVITKLLGIKYQSLIIRDKKTKRLNLEIFKEDISKINFNQKIKDAETQGNYRLAIRYLYLKYLKVLSDKELIEWKINKTNKDYRKEIKKTQFFSEFKHLTTVFEHVWYGEFDINSTMYNKHLKDYEKIFSDFL